MIKNNSNKNLDFIFSEIAENNLSEIIKKYGLEIDFEEITKKLLEIKNLNDKKIFLDGIPKAKIVKTIKKFLREEIQEKDFLLFLKKDFSFSEEKAKEFFNEIKTKVLIFIKKVVLAEEDIIEENEIDEKTSSAPISKKVFNQKKSSQSDSYREKVD